MNARLTSLLVLLTAFLCCTTADAQSTSSQESRSLESQLPINILHDQKAIWTAPTRLRQHDLSWIVPVSFGLAGIVASDTAIESQITRSPGQIKTADRFSTVTAGALAGTAGAAYLLGRTTHNDKLLETGLLSAQAVADTFVTGSAIKFIAGRERPGQGDMRGHFWQSGDSFPSMHAMTAFSIASVLTHQYPGRVTKLLAYATASAVAISRVAAERHFTADVVVGSALGFYIGRQALRSRNDADVNATWGTFEHSSGDRPADVGTASAYVPLDSWVYAAFDRLSALGLLQTGFASLRPWTRLECARLLAEADGLSAAFATDGSDAARIYLALAREFSTESIALDNGTQPQFEVESLYSKLTGIAGPPLRDGYHFAQTIQNDFGRPYSEGLNAYTGMSARANAGPLAFYIRAEHQRSPQAPALSPDTQSAIAAADGLSVAPAQPASGTSDVRLLDAYVSLNIRNNQLSFGKQSLWWGPSRSGPMLFSDNAEPITMFRIDRVSPFKLPSVLGFLGPTRTEFFIGRLSGHQFVRNQNGQIGQPGLALTPQPFIHGAKISFKPTSNLELGVGRTVIFAGPGIPATLGTFWRSMVSQSTSNSQDDPGDRRTAFDLSYRVPHLRDWLTVYFDSFTEDEPFPLPWTRTAWNPGIYIPKVPHANKLDFRAEGMLSNNRGIFPGFYYFNVRYRSGYTNDGQLLGNTIGREGTGIQLWTNYWFSPRNTLQFSYRGVTVDREFLQGGTVHDFSVSLNKALTPDMSLAASIQYERWRFPALVPGAQTNIAASIQLTYTPHWKLH